MPSIRSYRPSDWDSFLALDRETGLSTLRSAPQEEQDAFLQRWATALKAEWAWGEAGPTKDESLLLVLEHEGAFAGHLWLCEERDAFSGAPRLWILSVAIVESYRSRGWGRLLMERAVEEAKARKLSSVGLSVAADNIVARKLYEEMGFEATRLSMFKRL